MTYRLHSRVLLKYAFLLPIQHEMCPLAHVGIKALVEGAVHKREVLARELPGICVFLSLIMNIRKVAGTIVAAIGVGVYFKDNELNE